MLPAGFVDKVFTMALPRLTGAPGEHYMDVLTTPRGFAGKIEWVVLNGTVYWGAREGASFVACGAFRSRKPSWVEMLAAAKPAARGKGLYAAVLQSLRENLGRQLLSDQTLSDANIIVWSRLGKIDDRIGRFKINPPPSKSAVSAAVSLVALEVV